MVRKPADVADINGTQSTLLALALLANTNYGFWMFLSTAGAANTAQQFQLHAMAAGAAVQIVDGHGFTNGAATQAIRVAATGANFISSFPGAGGGSWTIWGVVTIGVNATTLQVDVVDTGVTNSVKGGSLLSAWVVT
jgi:hypothetical protein